MDQTLVQENFGKEWLTGKAKVIVTESLRAKGFFYYIWHHFVLGKKTGKFLYEIPWNKNTIMFGTNTGKDLILKRLIGDNTYSTNILYCDIGTSTTTPAVTDTQITAAVARAGSPAMSQASNVVSFQFFWADAALANGTYNEVGAFVDGSSTINTGQIFNHVLFSTPYTKVSSVDTTVQIDFTAT